jgi:hypothetical protein
MQHWICVWLELGPADLWVFICRQGIWKHNVDDPFQGLDAILNLYLGRNELQILQFSFWCLGHNSCKSVNGKSVV